MSESHGKSLWRLHQAAARCGVSWRHFLRLVDRGAAPAGIRLGAARRWDPDVIERWIADGCPPARSGGTARQSGDAELDGPAGRPLPSRPDSSEGANIGGW